MADHKTGKNIAELENRINELERLSKEQKLDLSNELGT